MSDLPRKNCWTIAEHAGHATPDGLQHLLARASWDDDGVRDDLRDYVVDGLGDTGTVLVVDETGDVKKGVRTVGVQRQYTGTAGRIENSQVAVYLTYATDAGHAFIDRALYLPRSWTTDAERRTRAGVPDDIDFATKPALARQMITRALDAGVTASWVAGDEVYGGNPYLRTELEDRGVGYVLAVACSHQVDTGAGTHRADEIAKCLPRQAWQRLSAGDGAKGPRIYDWALIDITDNAERPGHRWLMIRRNIATGELAYYRCYSPQPEPLAVLVKVAGRRWTDRGVVPGRQGPVRPGRTPGPPLDLLAALDHPVHAGPRLPRRHCSPRTNLTASTRRRLIPLTCNEIQHLLNAPTTPQTRDRRHCLRWSTWRRRHQHRSRLCHYQRRTAEQT